MQIQHVMILEWATVFLMRFWQLHNKNNLHKIMINKRIVHSKQCKRHK